MEMCQKLCKSIADRVQRCAKYEGEHFEYVKKFLFKLHHA